MLGLMPRDWRDALHAGLAKIISLRRATDPDEIAKVVFWASDDSSFANGIELFVDGDRRRFAVRNLQ
jgi:hypothetical protein